MYPLQHQVWIPALWSELSHGAWLLLQWALGHRLLLAARLTQTVQLGLAPVIHFPPGTELWPDQTLSKRQLCKTPVVSAACQKDCLGGKCFNATNTPYHISNHVFPYISSTFYFIYFSLFPLHAGELGLLAAIPVCVLVMYQTLLTVHLQVNFSPSWG